jgi:hypothetical protein
MSIEAMKLALDALEDIFGKNKVDVGAINVLRQSIEQAEKQEPYGYFRYDMRLDAWVKSRDTNSGIAFYTHPPKREPLTDEKMFDLAEIAWRHGWASCRDAEYIGKEAEDERWGEVGAEVVQNIAAHGIKEEA